MDHSERTAVDGPGSGNTHLWPVVRVQATSCEGFLRIEDTPVKMCWFTFWLHSGKGNIKKLGVTLNRSLETSFEVKKEKNKINSTQLKASQQRGKVLWG